MTDSTPVNGEDVRGYPDRTFQTQILQCQSATDITFHEAGPSRFGFGEPLTRATATFPSVEIRNNLEMAAMHIRQGQLVAFPSETVYGLGANALSQTAAAKIYAAKKRPADNPLIVHVSDLEMLDTLLPSGYKYSEAYRALIKRFWPGALTLLFPVDKNKPTVPNVVTCGHATVAIRMPSHTTARALIALAKLPMAGPSANASGRPSPTTALHVMRDLGGQLDGSTSNEGRIRYILNGGACQLGLESTVIDGITAPDELRILRPGGVSVEQISEALHAEGLSDTVKLRVYGKDMERSSEQESNPTTPGMKYRHYSPTAKVILLQSSSLISASDRQPQAQTFADVIKTQLVFKNSEVVRIGVMSTTDSPLTAWVRQDWKASIPATTNNDTHAHLLSPLTLSSLPNVQIHPFDLGPSDKPDEYARRMFDGLRTLDEGPLHLDGDQCDVIFVEALIDDGVGLAVMNRLKKAASTTIMVNC